MSRLAVLHCSTVVCTWTLGWSGSGRNFVDYWESQNGTKTKKKTLEVCTSRADSYRYIATHKRTWPTHVRPAAYGVPEGAECTTGWQSSVVRNDPRDIFVHLKLPASSTKLIKYPDNQCAYLLKLDWPYDIGPRRTKKSNRKYGSHFEGRYDYMRKLY